MIILIFLGVGGQEDDKHLSWSPPGEDQDFLSWVWVPPGEIKESVSFHGRRESRICLLLPEEDDNSRLSPGGRTRDIRQLPPWTGVKKVVHYPLRRE